MKIFVDENIPNFTIDELVKLGHEVKDVRGTELEGIDDSTIWEMAQKEKRLIITTDKGFTFYRNENHNGIIVIILKQPTLMKIHQRIMNVFQQFSEKELNNTLLIIKDTVLSIRK